MQGAKPVAETMIPPEAPKFPTAGVDMEVYMEQTRKSPTTWRQGVRGGKRGGLGQYLEHPRYPQWLGSTNRRWSTPCIWVLLLTCSLLTTTETNADLLIRDYSGKPEQFIVVQSGKAVPMTRWLWLQAGDSVRVMSAEGRVTLEDDQGHQLTLTHENGPLQLPEREPVGWWSNLKAEFLKWHQSLAETDEFTAETISRGISRGPHRDETRPPRLLGMVYGDNLLPDSLPELSLFWSGGSAPYQVEVRDRNGIAWQAERNTPPLIVPGERLKAGRYWVRLSGQFDGATVGDSQRIYLLPVDKLPATARRIADSSLSADTRAVLTAQVLASDPRWRFAALQYAVRGADERLTRVLLGGRLPPSPE